MRVRIGLCLLLALTACTGGRTTATPQSAGPTAGVSPAAAPPSATPTPPVSAPVPAPVLLAVATKGGQLALYALAPGSSRAVLLRRLTGQSGRRVAQVSLSGGVAPEVCAVWQPVDAGSPDPSVLRCYGPGAAQGRVVDAHAGGSVGVRADGKALAWTGGDANNTPVFIADLAGDTATVRHRWHYAENMPKGDGVPEGVGALDWVGPHLLAVTDVGQDDEGRGLCLLDVNAPRRPKAFGFGRCLHPDGAEQGRGYAHFEQAVPVAADEVVAVERALACCADQNQNAPAARAIRLRTADGSVLGTVATALPGRAVTDVSGGRRAVVYTTARNVDEQLRVSVRWSGQAHGTPITGLPADLSLVTAQP